MMRLENISFHIVDFLDRLSNAAGIISYRTKKRYARI